MYHEVATLKEKDWSLNLEDSYYEEHPEEILPQSLKAVCQTAPGSYVNVVTPGNCGDPRDWLIHQLAEGLRELGVQIREIRYIDQCGCGGYVLRVFR